LSKKETKTMSKPTITPDLAWRAATDAGNRAMRAAGRTHWSHDDYQTAIREFERLLPAPRCAAVLDYGPNTTRCRLEKDHDGAHTDGPRRWN
jgi:hypothetical protein